MTLTGNNGFVTQTQMTNASGNYSFTNLPGGNDYTVTPSKTGDNNTFNGLESFDASQVARFVVGLDIPTANQIIAGDADGDLIMTSFDSSFIARYVTGLPGFALTSTWKFVPPNTSYPALGANQTAQNFTAILVGEVSGNWTPGGPFGPQGYVTLEEHIDSPLPASGVDVALPYVNALPGASITVPIKVSDLTGRGVRALDLHVTYDPTVLRPQDVPFDTAAGTLTAGMLVTSNAENAGHLILSAFQTTDIAGSGTLIFLKFIVVGTPGTTTSIDFGDFTDGNGVIHSGVRFNSGSPLAIATKGSISVVGSGAGSGIRQW